MTLKENTEINAFVTPILKYAVVSFNLMTFVVSVLMICGGAWGISEFNDAVSKDTNFASVYNLTFDLAVELLILGILGIFITSFAIAATYRENIFILKIVSVDSSLK